MSEPIYFTILVDANSAEDATEMADILFDQFPPMTNCTLGPPMEVATGAEIGSWAVPVEIEW